VAQNIRVNIEFDGEYKVTHAHSKYKYEPEQLPSSKISFKLSDLNADEQRNLVFQISVPKIEDKQSVEMASQEPMSQSQAPEDQQSATENHAIGKFQRRSFICHEFALKLKESNLISNPIKKKSRLALF
jgi:hypothetical protein